MKLHLLVAAAVVAAGCSTQEPLDKPPIDRSSAATPQATPNQKPAAVVSVPKVPNAVPATVSKTGTVARPRVASPSGLSASAASVDRRPWSSPAPPTIPPADQKVQRYYEVKGQGAVDVLGVCKIAEDSISCWDLDQNRNADLENRLKESCSRQSESRIQLTYGKKNRLIVARITRMPNSRSGIGLESMPGVDNYFSFQPITNTTTSFAGPRYQFDARMQALDPTAKTTRLRVGLTEPASTQARLDLKPGATATIDGNTVIVRSVRKGEPEQQRSYMVQSRDRSVWTVDVQFTRAKGRFLMMSFGFDDPKTGMVMVDKQGNPVPKEVVRKDFEKRMEEMQKNAEPPMTFRPSYEPKYEAGQIWMMPTGPDGKVQLVSTVNPAKIGSVMVSGSYRRTVDIEGIPLDPK